MVYGAHTRDTDGRILSQVHGKIEFKNVSFAYPTRPQTFIFKDLSFTVEPGETVAIVGASGSGKSTIAQLLLRFYDPSTGAISIDSRNIKDLNLPWARSKILGLVPQEVASFQIRHSHT